MSRSPFDFIWSTTQSLARVEFVLATITIVAGLAFWTRADFADVHRDAEAKVSNVALVIDEFAGRSLLAIDVVLKSVVARLAEQGLDELSSEPEREHLRRIASRLPETGGLFIADTVGNIVAGTIPYPSGANVSDREWFRILQDGKAELHVGRALKGRGVHNLFFPVARSIRRPNAPSLVRRKLDSKRRTLRTSFAVSMSDLARISVSTRLGMEQSCPDTP